jgi:hypothetical protein
MYSFIKIINIIRYFLTEVCFEKEKDVTLFYITYDSFNSL